MDRFLLVYTFFLTSIFFSSLSLCVLRFGHGSSPVLLLPLRFLLLFISLFAFPLASQFFILIVPCLFLICCSFFPSPSSFFPSLSSFYVLHFLLLSIFLLAFPLASRFLTLIFLCLFFSFVLPSFRLPPPPSSPPNPPVVFSISSHFPSFLFAFPLASRFLILIFLCLFFSFVLPSLPLPPSHSSLPSPTTFFPLNINRPVLIFLGPLFTIFLRKAQYTSRRGKKSMSA